MITVGSIKRESVSHIFPFLALKYKGRRKAIKGFTHLSPDYVFWIYPDGTLFDAKDSHKNHVPKGYESILNDEPDYGGFLRGRVASNHGAQLIVVYCRPGALVENDRLLRQFVQGMSQLPIPLHEDALVISDNGDIYGTLNDVKGRIDVERKTRHLLFSVGAVKRTQGRLYIGGRNCEALIRIGDTFTETFRYSRHVDFSSEPAEKESGSIIPIQLQIQRIQFYRRSINQLDSGMTAELELLELVPSPIHVGHYIEGISALPQFQEYEISCV